MGTDGLRKWKHGVQCDSAEFCAVDEQDDSLGGLHDRLRELLNWFSASDFKHNGGRWSGQTPLLTVKGRQGSSDGALVG